MSRTFVKQETVINSQETRKSEGKMAERQRRTGNHLAMPSRLQAMWQRTIRFVLVLVGGICCSQKKNLHVGAFAFTPRSSTRTRASPYSSVTARESAVLTDFWGTPRSTEEIEEFVMEAIQSVPPRTGNEVLEPRVEVLSAKPPLWVVHDFISEKDCRSIIEAAQSRSMKRSTMNAEGETSQDRTSSTVWLQEEDDKASFEQTNLNLILQNMAEQTSRICCLPPSHMENLQVVRYLPGQEFALHTDHLDSFNDLECRGRLATSLVYLEEPTKGGATRFHEFEIDVPPQLGSAVFFWNTLERPGSPGYAPEMFLTADARLRHAGLPVVEGEKWICNRWIHPIDYEGANVRGLQRMFKEV